MAELARWTQQQYEDQGSPRVNPHHAKAFDVEYVEFAERFTAAGGTEKELAFILGTNKLNFQTWKKENPDFKTALKKGKQLTLSRLIGAGIQAAQGTVINDTTVTEQHTVLEDGTIGGLVPGSKVEVKKFTKTIPPDNKLIQFLASALSRQLGTDDWISKQFTETKVSGKVEHVIDSAAIQKQIETQAGNLTKKISCDVIDSEVQD